MSKRNRFTAEQRASNVIKSAVNTMIKWISIIAVIVSLGIIILLYAGPQINFITDLVFHLAVPSIVLAISAIVVYELWIQNGRRSAYEEEDYINLLKEYSTKSDNLDYASLQNFLDNELTRRYNVEKDRLTRRLERENELLAKLKAGRLPGARKKSLRDWIDAIIAQANVNAITRALGTIRVTMPYEKSEEFDYLRYNLQDVVYKEFSPDDTRKHLNARRTKKYIGTLTFTIIGFNVISIGGNFGNFWVAVVMSCLAAITILASVIGGFSTGYYNIKIVSTGVYKTANSYIDQAVAYCKRYSKDLYYRGPTEYRVSNAKPVDIVPTVTVIKVDDIFTKAEQEVTRS